MLGTHIKPIQLVLDRISVSGNVGAGSHFIIERGEPFCGLLHSVLILLVLGDSHFILGEQIG